jgi:hypothetical protein
VNDLPPGVVQCLSLQKTNRPGSGNPCPQLMSLGRRCLQLAAGMCVITDSHPLAGQPFRSSGYFPGWKSELYLLASGDRSNGGCGLLGISLAFPISELMIQVVGPGVGLLGQLGLETWRVG